MNLAIAGLAALAAFKTRLDADILTGKKYGVIEVGEVVGRKRFPSGQSSLVYRVHCTRCGRYSRMASREHIMSRPQFCRFCVRTEGASAQSVHLRSGESLVDISRRTGIPVDTLYKRWRRGWPESAIDVPKQPKRMNEPGYGTGRRKRKAQR